MSDFLENLRDAALPRDWTRGVELCRSGAVVLSPGPEAGGELQALVRSRTGTLCLTVRLFPEDGDWGCDCPADTEVCAHVVAAALAWDESRRSGTTTAAEAPPSLQPAPLPAPARLVYRLHRQAGRLAFDRLLVDPATGAEQILPRPLIALARGLEPGLFVAAAPEDWAVEQAIGSWRGGTIPSEIIPRLFSALAPAPELTLDGAPIRIHGRPLAPIIVRLEDQAEGFRLRAVRNPAVDEWFGREAALTGGTLRPLEEIRLTAPEREQLPRGRLIRAADTPELVQKILPDLRRRVPVEIVTGRLPGTVRVAPRLQIEVREDPVGMLARGIIVYGDPVFGRIEDGRMVHIEGPIPVRDEAAERILADRLRRRLDLVPEAEMSFVGEAAVAFAQRLARFEGQIVGDAHQRFFLAPPLVPQLTIDGERFSIDFTTAAPLPLEAPRQKPQTGTAAPEAVLLAWERGGTLAPLLEGGWSPLPIDWLRRHGALVADLLAARRTDGILPRAALPDLARLTDSLGLPPPPAFGELKQLIEGCAGLPEAALPADLTAELRSYQKRGVDWLVFLRRAGLGAILADDMGLGKTVQALAAISGRTLVSAPASVLFNWEREIRRFRPNLHVATYHGPRRRLDLAADVTLTTYAILRLDQEPLSQIRWETLILDEAQAIKNPDSQVARAAFRIPAGFRLAMTGTPIENRLDELWSLFHFTNPGWLGPRADFEARYARPIAGGDAGTAARLARRIGPFVLRRLKREVAPELPPRTEMVLKAQLSAEERQVYDAVRAAGREELARLLDAGGSVFSAWEALLRLRQSCCHPGLIPGAEIHRSAKLELLVEALETVLAEGHKALVFSQWTSLLDLVEPLLAAAGMPFLRLDGSTADRGGVVDAFQDPAGPPLLLISLKAGGVGLNLTAADHLFLLDPWWNPATEDQAIDRAHRIGQDKPVLVYRLVAEDTVEERILALQEKKRGLADAALAGAAGAQTWTREDLIEILNL